MKLIGKYGLASVLAFCLLATAPVRAESLADALAHGYENSGLLEQNRALLRAADEGVASAVGALLPVINWSANAQTQSPQAQSFLTGSLQISAELTLYDGGNTQLAIDAQKETVLATRQSLLNVEQQVLLRIVEAYMEVRRAAEFVALRQNNVRLITQELRAAQDRFEVGEITRTDVAAAEARLASARSQLAAEEGGLVRAQAEYLAAVGRRAGNLQPVSPVPISQSIPEARALALQAHPSIREAQHSVTVSELNIARAESALRPTVSLSGSIRINQDGDDTETLGLSVGGPIYQGGRIASSVRDAMARRDATRASLLITSQQIEQNVYNAYSFLEVSRASRDASEREVRAATVAFQGVREEATLGARTTLDVLNAEQDLLDARANLISAQVDEVISTYSLLSAMGQLTAEKLRLQVQIYDPTAYYNLVKDAPTTTSEQGRALDRVLEAIGGGN
ncbi:TolC family outer membrane protein [Flavimaricola marinus]|uniref:Outer membrane efflux protein BepC n=1 Tax=Flavimaricola marinus TaxID=1819565 RepID=A0A238LH54_9RHOB|nr:TolC family outer membrane protein [Flavimaricola marinus]SMY08958.1 Outer membrane efflux protein BepC precursor [Flavimaricola marinus]